MDTVTLTAIIQAIVQIVTIVSSIWSIFNKKTNQIEQRFEARMNKIDSRLTALQNQDNYNRRP